MSEVPLQEAACTCRAAGECETCRAWKVKAAEIAERRKADPWLSARQPHLEEWAKKKQKSDANRKYRNRGNGR